MKHIIKSTINQVLKDIYKLEDVKFQVEYPPSPNLGDYSCSVAMAVSKELKKKPMDIGKEIAKTIDEKTFSKVEVVKPGFINFYLSEKALLKNLDEILKDKEKFGQLKSDKKLKIQVEFISANPTGPLTLANGRGGFSGDVLSNILELAGHKVEREYYVNNYGEQVRKLGHSILKDDQAQYNGDYIDNLAKRIKEKDPEKIGLKATEIIVKEMIVPAVKKAKIKFDSWFFEKDLHDKGEVDKMLEHLKEIDLIFEKDGATWLKTTDKNEDDKDRVLVKSSGEKTYFLADIAYHWDKFHKRKFDKVINLWGADHHGYVPRMHSAMTLLGFPNQLDILLMQLIRLIKDGKEVRMSKRKGIYVTLDELINQVGLDVTRFFFLMHANNKAMDFDLTLAKEKSSKNPVFYVQYAHARICSILKKSSSLSVIPAKAGIQKLEPSEKELIKELIKWPELIFEVAQNYEVHKIPFYAISMADKFHDFYENCQVIENDKVNEFRLELVSATQQVLQNILKVLGVNAPEKM